ncbi:MAG TPA: hypothetical protein VMX75_15700, partial [Spirochaetia bacterium]|nr:hypothetical protein [Spirochaetia bacterium]
MKKMKIYFFLFSGLMLYQGAAFSTNISLESAPVWGVRKRITETALEYLGTPYVYAGISSEGVDCSGLVYCV